KYKVFKEQVLVCWDEKKKKVQDKTYFSRVDIELINEQVRLFYSALDEVSIDFAEDYFKTVEYVHLGLNEQFKYYPLEEVTIHFNENGSYNMDSKLFFDAQKF